MSGVGLHGNAMIERHVSGTSVGRVARAIRDVRSVHAMSVRRALAKRSGVGLQEAIRVRRGGMETSHAISAESLQARARLEKGQVAAARAVTGLLAIVRGGVLVVGAGPAGVAPNLAAKPCAS